MGKLLSKPSWGAKAEAEDTAGELGRLEQAVAVMALREASRQHVRGCLGEAQPLDTLEGRSQEAGLAFRAWTHCPRE